MIPISDYLEQLCREHEDVGHTDSECHYVNLNEDHHQTAQAERLRYPAVKFETSGYVISSDGDALIKRHECHLQVETHVSDTGDYVEVEHALAVCDNILTDFLVRMCADKRARSPRWMNRLDTNSIEVVQVENEGNALYGVLSRFYLSEFVCTVKN